MVATGMQHGMQRHISLWQPAPPWVNNLKQENNQRIIKILLVSLLNINVNIAESLCSPEITTMMILPSLFTE
jgi:hypothetical protein